MEQLKIIDTLETYHNLSLMPPSPLPHRLTPADAALVARQRAVVDHHLAAHPRPPRRPTSSHLVAPPPQGAPHCLVGPSELHRRTPSSYIYLRTPKRTDTEPKT